MNKNYWDKFYANQRGDNEPSLFAQYVLKNYFSDDNCKLIELGCGNGRDSIYFSKNGVDVLAVDQVEAEVDFLNSQFSEIKNLKFISADFTKLGIERLFDVIYSRFTIHSINLKEQIRVLNWAYSQLNENGLFCIEVRGQRNELFKLGKKVLSEDDAYIYNDHYRRFNDFDVFCKDLSSLGFTIEYSAESKGFSPYKGTNETFIRVIARK